MMRTGLGVLEHFQHFAQTDEGWCKCHPLARNGHSEKRHMQITRFPKVRDPLCAVLLTQVLRIHSPKICSGP